MTRIAMFMHGGLAPELSREDVPAIAALVSRLAGLFEVTVYTLKRPDGDCEPFSCGNAGVRVVRSGEDDHIVKTAPRLLHAFWYDHRRKPFGLVHGFWALPGGLTAVLAGRTARIPSIVTMLGGEAACFPEIGYGNMRKTGPRAATLWTCRHADTLTALTCYQLDHLQRFSGRKFRRTRVIPFGADDSLFPYSDRRPESPPYRLLHIGHLNRVKDQATLLRAFQNIARRVDCRLTIIGQDTMNGSLQRLAGELGISPQVTFEGFVPHEDLHRHLACAHLLLHSSLYEGEGVVFAEAASSGLPICGTHVGLLADLGDALGATVEPGDPDALAEAAIGLLSDGTRINKLREQGRNWALEHTAEWTTARFAELYRSLLRARQGMGTQEREWATA
jgi:glycosyltransferase involved in cell wall biosynthesis